MTNNKLYTRCPACSTAFKVTDELLALAEGKVRCGACLAVFQATDYMLRPTDDNQVSEAADNERQPVETIGQEFQSKETNQTVDTTSSETVIEPEPEKIEAFDYENESFDFDEEPSDFDKDFSTQDDLNSSDHEEIEVSEWDQVDEEEEAAWRALEEDSDDSHLEFDSNYDKNEPSMSEEALDSIDDLDSEDQANESALENDNDIEEFEEDHFDEQPLSDDDDNQELADEQLSDSELANQLNVQMQETDTTPDPLDEFDKIVKEDKPGIKSKLVLLVTLTLFLVAVFKFWSNRQALAWSENWGSTVTSLCRFLPCELKPKRDIGKIKLLQRQLSPDEERENFLDVKILLMNEATFDQPYPTIKIAFSNKNGERVSVKSFLPSDYLEQDAQTSMMPSATEVHIHFETQVSHPDALGFEFIFE